jgi:neutral ceramidase
VLHHTGPAGNQSPRHVTKANTFAEAERIGQVLAAAVEKVLPEIEYTSAATLASRQSLLDLPRREIPALAEAQEKLARITARLERLRAGQAPRQEVRTAECDVFGAEETVTLARAAASGRLRDFYDACLPAEVQILRVGPWRFAAWPGEIFVEYALALKAECDNAFLISCANGETQTYIVTREAAAKDWYETFNAIFAPQSGEILLGRTLEMLARMPA